MPAYKSKKWDGKIRLLKLTRRDSGKIYSGLLTDIINYCDSQNYTCQVEPILLQKNHINEKEIEEYIKKLNLTAHGTTIEARDYQITTIKSSIKNNRQVCLSSTSSGKSLAIYVLYRYFIDQGLKGLIVVPNVSLIHQMKSDFIDYSNDGFSVEDNLHLIYQGQEKSSKKQVILSTYQSLHLIKDNSFFESFDFILWDEVHQVKSTVMTNILEKTINTPYKIGFTGSLDNITSNKMTIKGLFGDINKIITARELIDRNEATDILIKCLFLKYDKESCKLYKNLKYQDEMKYLISNVKRNQFIKNLAFKLKGNTIILSNYVDNHGKVLYEMLLSSKYKGNRNIYFIHGGVAGEDREKIRKLLEKETDSIIVATSSIMSTGVSIRNLHNIIFSTPGKSMIRNIQSIGRLLRQHESKSEATLYDIVDDLSIGKHKNFSILHYIERMKIYNSEKHKVKQYKIEFNQ
jgi:superfamily II DNA or RNA helicase